MSSAAEQYASFEKTMQETGRRPLPDGMQDFIAERWAEKDFQTVSHQIDAWAIFYINAHLEGARARTSIKFPEWGPRPSESALRHAAMALQESDKAQVLCKRIGEVQKAIWKADGMENILMIPIWRHHLLLTEENGRLFLSAGDTVPHLPVKQAIELLIMQGMSLDDLGPKTIEAKDDDSLYQAASDEHKNYKNRALGRDITVASALGLVGEALRIHSLNPAYFAGAEEVFPSLDKIGNLWLSERLRVHDEIEARQAHMLQAMPLRQRLPALAAEIFDRPRRNSPENILPTIEVKPLINKWRTLDMEIPRPENSVASPPPLEPSVA